MKSIINDIKNIVKNDAEKITLKSIINNGANGSYLILFVVTILIMVPIPVVSTIFGIIDCIIAYQVLTDKKNIKLPKKLLNLSINKTTLATVIEKVSFYINKIEGLTKNRLIFLTNKKFINILIFLFCLLSISPVPFLSVFAVSGILLVIFGYLNRDGLFVCLGILAGGINIIFQILFLILGKVLFIKILSFLGF